VIDTPGVVLIDELDLHLHPKWQRHVVTDLKRVFPQIQFVATTHSPFIVQSLASDELINLDRVVESSPNEMSISEVSEWLMGVASSFSYENAEAEKQSQSILERLDNKETTGDDIQVDIDNISNPGVRAFLNLAKMAKGK
jgi:AAA15 family ATPase/GTPase